MNDQPKPASGHWEGNQWCPHAEPKPASGEWTAKPSQTHGWYIEFDRGNGASIGNELTAKGIVNAHNAALAAFREGKARCEKQLDATMQQLAAARKEQIRLTDFDAHAQLAAERAKNWIRAEDNPGYNRYE